MFWGAFGKQLSVCVRQHEYVVLMSKLVWCISAEQFYLKVFDADANLQVFMASGIDTYSQYWYQQFELLISLIRIADINIWN